MRGFDGGQIDGLPTPMAEIGLHRRARRWPRRLAVVMACAWGVAVPVVFYLREQEHLAELQRVRLRVERLADVDRRVGDDVQKLGVDISQLRTRAGDIENKLPPDLPALVAKVKESVVTVETEFSTGSGFAVDVSDIPSGYVSAVITAHHVIDDAVDGGEIAIRHGLGRGSAVVSSFDEENDLALLFTTLSLPPLEWASRNQRAAAEGQSVVALGSPFGLEGTTTSGIISKVTDRYVVTDAAINPGNSGGPLLNHSGEVLGVSSFTLTRAQNFNVAVRIERACNGILRCS